MPLRKTLLVSMLLALSAAQPVFAQDAAEVDTVVSAVRQAHPDASQLCQSGPDGIRKAVTAAIMKLMGEGKLKGDPQQTGNAAGMRIGQTCRG